jgi:DNA-binding transcriptional LysR family regulator
MSRTLGRLRETTGDPLLVRAGRNMVLTPYAEGIRERTQNAVLKPAPYCARTHRTEYQHP